VSLTGLIDLHSHILPGIDDGCRTVEVSLACVQSLVEHGFRGTICTPHMAIEAFAENTPPNVAHRVKLLQDVFDAAGLEYQLWEGGELRIAEHTLSWMREHGVPTLGPSRHVLVDYWGSYWPAFADGVIEYLLQEGFHPILAHPERMDLEDREWDSVLDRLQHDGVWLQGNLRCIAGREGPRVGRRAQRLLAEDRYRLLATDMHGTPDLPDRLAGIQVADMLVGPAKVRELLAEVPKEVLHTGSGP
jgi:protein-tyrosine phosphatase